MDSDIETLVLSRDGRSLLLLGCWNQDAPGGGSYAIRGYVGGAVEDLDIDASTGAWIDNFRVVLGDSSGTIKRVDFSKSPPSVSVIGRLQGAVKSVDISPSGDRLVALTDQRKSGSESVAAPVAVIVSLKTNEHAYISLPEGASAAFWRGDQKIILEAGNHWIIVDTGTAKVIERRLRPASPAPGNTREETRCNLAGSASVYVIGWCLKSGQLVKLDENGGMSVIANIPTKDSFASVSVASDLVR
ncbi:hypothetical protein ACIBQ1_08160 [Nonomuraea sp. NPDC050153]|uniref:hypothetical protein n=1 Tax=Nonomuraea sp. NPDC050153 TaxID=3364359 RepID=UPI00378922A2